MKEWDALLRPALFVAALGAGARAMAALAGILLAHKFGAGEATDAYLLAKTVPIGVYFILDSVLYNALVPILRREMAPAPLFRALLLRSFVLAAALAAGVYFGAPALIGLLARGAGAATQQDAVALQHLTAWAILFAVPASCLKAWNACHDRYIAASLDGFVVSGLFLAALVAPPASAGVLPIALALPVAFAALLAVQGWLGRGAFGGGTQHTAFNAFPWVALRRPMLPLLALNAVQQAQVWLVVVLAAHFRTGSISLLHYSYGIAQIPVGVLDLVLFSTLFPFAARLAARDDRAGLDRTFRAALTAILLLCVPLAIWLILSRSAVIDAILARGSFSAADSRDTAALLLGHAAAIPGWCVEALGCRMLFAANRHARYLGIVLFRLAAFLLLSAVLMPSLGLSGLSLAFAGAFTLSALLSVYVVRRERTPQGMWRWRTAIGPAVALITSTLAMIAGVWACDAAFAGAAPNALYPVTVRVILAAVVLAGTLYSLRARQYFQDGEG